MNRFHIVNYDTGRYPFRRFAEEVLGHQDIENIHDHISFEPAQTRELDQSTPIHRRLYSLYELNNKFLTLYEKFISDVVHNNYGCPLVYQTRPTFRVHAPGGISVGEFHKDREYKHNPKEVNYWVPLTHCYGNNSVWIESYEDAKDFHPVEMKVGECMIFDGSNLMHGNYKNDTPITRISFDFRVIPLHQFTDRPEELSVSAHIGMSVGKYYRLYDGNGFTNAIGE